jgi:hypothetical protein
MSREFKTISMQLERLSVEIKAERVEGHPLLDSEVSIGGNQLCWISFQQKDEFIKELQQVIDKYKI